MESSEHGPEIPAAVGSTALTEADLTPTPSANGSLWSSGDPLSRPFAVARGLAGFMDATSARQHIPFLAELPDDAKDALRARFGRAACLPAEPRAGKPRFEGVRNPEVLRLLDEVAARLPPPGPANLVGFEWVEIEPLIAGRLLTEPLVHVEQRPDPADEVSLARFCMLSFAKAPRLQGTGQLGFASPLPLELVPAGLQAAGSVLTIQYQLRPAVAPIHVLALHHRTVALTGLARLVALRALGVERALCAVSYGYGVHALNALPPALEETVRAERPPLIRDFADDALAALIAVRPQLTVVQMDVHAVQLG